MNTHTHHCLHNHHQSPPPKNNYNQNSFPQCPLQIWHLKNTTLWPHSFNGSNELCVCFFYFVFCYFEKGSHEYWLFSNSWCSRYHLPSTGIAAVSYYLVYVAFFFKFKILLYLHFYLYVSVSVNLCEYMPWVCLVIRDARIEAIGAEGTWDCETTSGCWDLNLHPQQEFKALLAAEPLSIPFFN